MPGLYRLEPDGSALVQTPQGAIRMAVDEATLQDLGYTPEVPPPQARLVGPGSGALAENAAGLGGAGNVPETAQDFGGPGSGMGGAPTQRLDQDILEGAAGDPSVQKLSPDTEVMNLTRETQQQTAGEPKPRNLRGGAEVVELGGGGEGAPPVERPRFAKVGGKDIRAGYTRQVGVGQDALDEAEGALADASLDRKLAAQNIAERESKRAEQVSGALGRQIRAEENAIREQERRDRAMEADFAKRQGEIDKERKAIESLEIKPDTLFDREDWAKVIGAIVAIAGGAAHGGSGLGGPSPLDRLQQASDRSIERQTQRREMRRQNLAARETELERIEKHYGDPRLAAAELRDRQRGLIQMYGQKMLRDADATDALDRFKTQLAGWDAERAQGRLERQQALGDKIVEQYQHIPERVVQVGGPRPLTDEQRKRLVRVNGRDAFTARESAAQPIQDKVTALESIQEQLAYGRQLANDSSLTDIERQRKLEAWAENMGPALAVAQGQGAMSEDEAARMKSRLGNAGAVWGNKERASTLIGETERFFGAQKDSVVRGSVYADPDATTPFQGAPSRARRYE